MYVQILWRKYIGKITPPAAYSCMWPFPVNRSIQYMYVCMYVQVSYSGALGHNGIKEPLSGREIGREVPSSPGKRSKTRNHVCLGHFPALSPDEVFFLFSSCDSSLSHQVFWKKEQGRQRGRTPCFCCCVVNRQLE